MGEGYGVVHGFLSAGAVPAIPCWRNVPGRTEWQPICMKPALFLPVLSLFLTPALTGCGEPPAGAPSAKQPAGPWVVSDWSEWKKQDTGPAAKVEVRKEVAETAREADAPAAAALPPEAAKAGVLVLGAGEPFSAVKYEGPIERLPLDGYEISWDGMRMEGSDFFCALTFPVGKPDRCVTLVTGGWGGWTVGISTLNHSFANENETTRSFEFKTGRWYRFTLQASPECLRCLIDGKEQFKVGIKDKPLAMHPSEVRLCMPLGFASYQTAGAIRNVQVRALKPGELVPDELPE